MSDTYEEPLLFRVFNPGTPKEHKALMPSELDIALLNAQIDGQEEELERLGEMPVQPEIERLLQRREEGKELSDTELGKVLAHEAMKAAEFDAINTYLWRLRKRLGEALEEIDAPEKEGTEVQTRVFVLRDFSYGERLDAENRNSIIDPRTGARDVQIPQRNLDLLKTCLQGERVDGKIVPIPDPSALRPSKIAEVLINRQWARAEMSPVLAQHFRGGG